MYTSYDEVWETFLNNYEVPDGELPKTDKEIYRHIKNGVMHFNNRLQLDVKCDDSTETLSVKLTNNQLLILAHYIRLVFLINRRTFYEQLWQPFAADIGLRNFRDQLNSLRNSVKEQEEKIDKIILNSMDDFL